MTILYWLEFAMPRRKKPISFRTSEVSRLVGATHHQLAYWDKTGLVSPSLKPASGRGSRRLYSIEDIFELQILVRLLDSSLSLQRIRSSFRFIRGQSQNVSSFIVLTDGKTVYFYEDENVLYRIETARTSSGCCSQTRAHQACLIPICKLAIGSADHL